MPGTRFVRGEQSALATSIALVGSRNLEQGKHVFSRADDEAADEAHAEAEAGTIAEEYHPPGQVEREDVLSLVMTIRYTIWMRSEAPLSSAAIIWGRQEEVLLCFALLCAALRLRALEGCPGLSCCWEDVAGVTNDSSIFFYMRFCVLKPLQLAVFEAQTNESCISATIEGHEGMCFPAAASSNFFRTTSTLFSD